VRIDFQGRGEVKTFSWARVPAMSNDIQLALRVPRQIGTLGQVLAQQPIGVFVGAALPGAVRVGKEDLDRQPLSQALMLGHLFAPIVGQRFAQQHGLMPELLGEALSGNRRIRSLHPGSMIRRVVRSTSVPTAEPLRAPLMRSPSQCPGAVL
jgi:hypothetical protein